MTRAALAALGTVILPFLWTEVVQAENTACLSSELDWYTDVVGETPCKTYERLRRVCNSKYEVPALPLQVPADSCDDTLPYCCCNYISFQLSMLCSNCQHDTVANGTAGGVSSRPGNAFDEYRGSCGKGTGRTLPSDVQDAVCSEGIRIDDYLYDGGWDDGSWSYLLVKGFMRLSHAANINTFSRCPDNSTSLSGTTNAAGSPATARQPGDGSPPSHTGLVIGISLIAAVTVLILGIFSVVLWRRRCRAHAAKQTSPSPPAGPGAVEHIKRSRPSMMHSVISLAKVVPGSKDPCVSPAASCFSAYDDPFSSSGLSSAGDCGTPSPGPASTFADRKHASRTSLAPPSPYRIAYSDAEEDIGTASVLYYASPKHLSASPLASPSWNRLAREDAESSEAHSTLADTTFDSIESDTGHGIEVDSGSPRSVSSSRHLLHKKHSARSS